MEGAIAEAARRGEVDLSLVSVDSTTVRAHHDAAGMHLGPDALAALEKAADAAEKARQKVAARRIIGRRRHLGCDTLGLLLTVLVDAGVTLLSRIAAAHPHITKAWVDDGYRTTAIDHGARLGIDVHPVQRPPGTRGFTIIPRRWTIERGIGRLTHHRRLARDTNATRTAPKR